MPVVTRDATLESLVSPEDELRANVYRLLARWLVAAPSQSDLAAAKAMSGDETDFGKAVQTFSHVSARIEPKEVQQEYQDLFIGVGRGELLPYASYYLAGFLNEKPLAKLRNDMARLGIERDPKTKDPEDHIAALMEMQAGLIMGDYGKPASLTEQKQFFEIHVGSWAKLFFADLEGAKQSVLYASLATIGRLFMEIEETAFLMS
ncbi:chaperone protein TorD [bacterium MnTg02]|nr:chaperone protein TorD [bacterium MnTg02]